MPGALSEDDPTFEFLGPVRPDSVAQQVAEGIAVSSVKHSCACPAFEGIVANLQHESASSHYAESNSLSGS